MSRTSVIFSLLIITGVVLLFVLPGQNNEQPPQATTTTPTATAPTTTPPATSTLIATSSQPRATSTDSADTRPISYTPSEARDLINIRRPQRAATVTSPLQIAGEARGQWFFEASAPVVLIDWDGRIIAEGAIQANGEWMTENFVPFSGQLNFTPPENTGPQSVRGSLIIQRANPSGQPQRDMAVEIPVRFQR